MPSGVPLRVWVDLYLLHVYVYTYIYGIRPVCGLHVGQTFHYFPIKIAHDLLILFFGGALSVFVSFFLQKQHDEMR